MKDLARLILQHSRNLALVQARAQTSLPMYSQLPTRHSCKDAATQKKDANSNDEMDMEAGRINYIALYLINIEEDGF